MTDAERGGPYHMVLDVAIYGVERYVTSMDRVTPALEAAGGRLIGGEGLPPDQPATDAPRPRAVQG